MAVQSVPTRLWDNGDLYEAKIMSCAARDPQGRTGMERLTGTQLIPQNG
jgi:hypothetical protein